MESKTLREKAEHARELYRAGQITREEARESIDPYLEACNVKAKELAKKYGIKPKKIGGFASYVR